MDLRTTGPGIESMPGDARRKPGSAPRSALTLAVRTALATLPLLVGAAQLAAQDAEFCMECHASVEELASLTDDAPERLFLDAERFGGSVHSVLDCSDCHFDFGEIPHGDDASSVGCADCHDDVAETLAPSAHGTPLGAEAVSCAACHGVHDVLRAEDRESRLHPLNIYRTCGQCHFEADVDTANIDELMRDPLTDDAHALGILRSGLTVSATCVSCHGSHGIMSAGDPESPLAPEHVESTCAKCHLGVVEAYRESVHFLRPNGGDQLDESDQRGATCLDCHRPHEITKSDEDFRLHSVDACRQCHEDQAGSFQLTYHGKLSTLGFGGRAATCVSCHSAHLVVASTDERSRIHPDNIVATCAQCHEGSHAEFATYQVHVNPRDPESHPYIYMIWLVMSVLFVSVIVGGGLHVLLWLVRALVAGDWRRKKRTGKERYVRRWPKIYVVFHIWMMWSVLLLAATGLPLYYADSPWARNLMNFFGGSIAAGWVHRAAAIALGLLFVAFGTHIGWRWLRRREKGLFWGPHSMVPRWKDLQDFAKTFRWFLFLGPRPRYDRWTYWEKFDFWAATWGLMVIGLSGLVLWFPVQATRLVPGWFVNAALIIHGIEALLDIAFIFTVHMFHANLRPDKFPIDTMFLTGRVTEDELRHERPEEYDRLVAQGGLAQIADEAPTPPLRIAATILGWVSMLLGFFFVIAMAVAIFQRGWFGE